MLVKCHFISLIVRPENRQVDVLLYVDRKAAGSGERKLVVAQLPGVEGGKQPQRNILSLANTEKSLIVG